MVRPRLLQLYCLRMQSLHMAADECSRGSESSFCTNVGNVAPVSSRCSSISNLPGNLVCRFHWMVQVLGVNDPKACTSSIVVSSESGCLFLIHPGTDSLDMKRSSFQFSLPNLVSQSLFAVTTCCKYLSMQKTRLKDSSADSAGNSSTGKPTKKMSPSEGRSLPAYSEIRRAESLHR